MENMEIMLPKQLEVTMNYLLSTNLLTSWTIQGNNKLTSIIIRFQMDDQDGSPQQNAKYRRVPPSQIARDSNRIQGRKQMTLSQDTQTEAPPPEDMSHDQDTCKTLDTESNVATEMDQCAEQYVKCQGSPPMTHSMTRISSVKPSPIPQLDGPGLHTPVVDHNCDDLISVNSDPDTHAPVPRVLLKSSSSMHYVTRKCVSCDKYVHDHDIVRCCFKCSSLFCHRCSSDEKCCEHGHLMYPPHTLSLYMVKPPT